MPAGPCRRGPGDHIRPLADREVARCDQSAPQPALAARESRPACRGMSPRPGRPHTATGRPRGDPMRPVRPVGILGGVRIPFCRQNTAYADVGNLGMSVRTLGALVEKFGLHGQVLGEVAMGAVIKHSSDWNLGREAALSSGLSPLTPGITMQRACGTSLDT